MPIWYILKSAINSNGLETSNKFYETGKFTDVDPAFMFNFKTNNCTSEPDFNRQWWLEKVNVYNAWKLTKGKPQITVAVLDQGVDKTIESSRIIIVHCHMTYIMVILHLLYADGMGLM